MNAIVWAEGLLVLDSLLFSMSL